MTDEGVWLERRVVAVCGHNPLRNKGVLGSIFVKWINNMRKEGIEPEFCVAYKEGCGAFIQNIAAVHSVKMDYAYTDDIVRYAEEIIIITETSKVSAENTDFLSSLHMLSTIPEWDLVPVRILLSSYSGVSVLNNNVGGLLMEVHKKEINIC